MTAAIDVRNAFRIHRSTAGTAVALQGLTLQVAEGEVVVVLGPSGSGKTTLLRTVAAFDTLSAGSARVLGTDVGSLGPAAAARFRAENLGLLDQHYARALSPDLSCVHTVGLGLELLGVHRAEARSRAAALLERVGLGDRLDDRPGRLSGGEQQRVALCGALAHRPRLLLADEPAGELDAESAETVYALISEFVRERRATALIVSHDEAAAEIADRLVYVRDGRVVEEGRPGERTSLVVTEPGWVRLPDPLLDAIGSPGKLRAEHRDGELVLSSAVAGSVERLQPAVRGRAHASSGDALAELRDVTKAFPGARAPVVSGLSRTFAGGTFTALVGRSGSGKTTLLHLLAGLDRPTSGEVVLRGREIGRLGRAQVAAVRREHVALVTQEPGLVPHLTARENVELGLLVRGVTDGAEARAAEVLGEVGLGDRLAHRADRLSAG
ncbi:MAG TPA: ATP-binding cassette domain-containing protein, partial [Gaiellaceae bacterium]|nr:ATP-binding cassette domain-containing protein [Gaiellaceae bacterium]